MCPTCLTTTCPGCDAEVTCADCGATTTESHAQTERDAWGDVVAHRCEECGAAHEREVAA